MTRMNAECIASIPKIDINVDGADVFVTGQNGSGKSTIRKAIMWVLAGNTSDGEKLIPYDSSGLPFVEIELTDGEMCTKISKEIVETTKGGKLARSVKCCLAGMPVTQKDLNSFFEQYVPISALPLLLNPFEFFKLNTETRREMLTALFGNVTDEQVLASDESLSELDLENYPRVKDCIKKLKNEHQDIPVKIDTLTRQIKDVEDIGGLEDAIIALKERKKKVEKALAGWTERVKLWRESQKNLSDANVKLHRMQNDAENLRDKIQTCDRRIIELREQYKQLRDSGVCPTCGQKVSSESATKSKEKIVEAGVKTKTELEKLKHTLATVEGNITDLQSKIEKLIAASPVSNDYDEFNRLLNQRDTLQAEITARDKKIAAVEYQLKLNAENQQQIDALAVREKEVGKKITAYEKQIALYEKFVARKAEMISDAINSHFRYVNFKMFEMAKSGEIKNACTATMGGVPYELLSKGEKMKAALDVLNALQGYYDVEFPLIIDDAESYTSNSITDITENQKFILQVAEGQELKIVLAEEKGARTA